MLFGKKKNPLEEEPLKHVKDLLLSDEEVLYISDKWIKPNHYNWYRLVLTNKRLFDVSAYRDSDNKPYIKITKWKYFRRVRVEENIVKILNIDGTNVSTYESLPREDIEIVYKIIKERIDAISEKSKQQTPTQSLKYLKEMLDEGLITQAEYDAKKADLLSRM